MARAGIYKWDVKEARDRLIRDGKHPSIDAVRAALGDTGSKTTIHRYLKELDQEEAGSSQVAVSEALLSLVAQLSERLQQEGRAQVEAVASQFDAERTALNDQIGRARQEAGSLRAQLERIEVALVDEREARAGIERELLAERTKGVQLGEQIRGQEQRLAEHAAHQQSLEQKHEQARQALEHFRASAKEQRDQDNRRHEQQVQQLQAEVRQLNSTLTERLAQLGQVNSSAAALTAEVGALRAQVSELRTDKERIEKELARARDAAGRAEALLQTADNRLQETRASEDQLRLQIDRDAARIRELELAGVRADAQLEAERLRTASLEAEIAETRKVIASYVQAQAGGTSEAKTTEADPRSIIAPTVVNPA